MTPAQIAEMPEEPEGFAIPLAGGNHRVVFKFDYDKLRAHALALSARLAEEHDAHVKTIEIAEFHHARALAAEQAVARLTEENAAASELLRQDVNALALAREVIALREMLSAERGRVVEECARVVHAHIGAAQERRRKRGQKLSLAHPDAQIEIQAEERGEDIAAEIIERNIRALLTASPPGEVAVSFDPPKDNADYEVRLVSAEPAREGK